ncbi:hypothetical protein AgCh_038005 [Apium graveolens]
MANKVDNIRSKAGSIKVGATGQVSTLMTRELDDLARSSSNHVSRKKNTQSFPVAVSCGESRKQTIYNPANTMRSTDQRTEAKIQRKTHNMRHTIYDIPMSASKIVRVHRKSVKDEKIRPQIVEVVDLKCGTSLKKAWSSRTSNNGKLKFSRLSASN